MGEPAWRVNQVEIPVGYPDKIQQGGGRSTDMPLELETITSLYLFLSLSQYLSLSLLILVAFYIFPSKSRESQISVTNVQVYFVLTFFFKLPKWIKGLIPLFFGPI